MKPHSEVDILEACEVLLQRIGRSKALGKLPAKPTVPEVAPLVQAYYALDGNLAGGSLHVVLDDGNVDDVFVSGCIVHAEHCGDYAGAALARTLLLMSKTQRRRLARF